MAKFDSENYVSAHERIKKFWGDYPNGSILTNAVTDKDGEITAIHASVFKKSDDTRASGTGHGYVYEMKSKAIEKAETIAVGRALAMIGYEVTNGIASAEEMEDFEEETKPKRKGLGRKTRGLGLKKKQTKVVEDTEEEDTEETTGGSSILDKHRARRQKLLEADEGEELEEDEEVELDDEDDDEEDQLAKFKTTRKRG